MTGQDLLFWLEEIWFDLTHFQQADVWSLVFRLVVLAVALVILGGVAQSVFKTASRGLAPIGRAVTAPGRSLLRRSRTRKHHKKQREQQEVWERAKREQEARNRVHQEEQEKRRQEELEMIKKSLIID